MKRVSRVKKANAEIDMK